MESRILWGLECLPRKHEDLSSNPSTHVQTQAWGMQYYNPCAGEVMMGLQELSGELIKEYQVLVRDLFSKNKVFST